MTNLAIMCFFYFAIFTQHVITPNEVYNEANNVFTSLQLIHKTKFPNSIKKFSIGESQKSPRHVLQKAIEVFMIMQYVKRENGIDSTRIIPKTPKSEVKPKDVKKIVDLILKDVLIIANHLNVKLNFKKQTYTDKVPTDVYNKLQSSRILLTGIWKSEISPNNVYQKAYGIHYDIEIILANLGYNTTINEIHIPRDKTPGDVMDEAIELHKVIRDVNKQEKYKIPDGVHVPVKHFWEFLFTTKPRQVYDYMNNIAADIISLKTKLKIETETVYPKNTDGKIPSDVFELTNKSKRLLQKLLSDD